MEAPSSFENFLARLKLRFDTEPSRNVMLLGLVFCRPELKLAKEEILPSLDYFNRESGKNIDFYFAGFNDQPAQIIEQPIKTRIPERSIWSFSLDDLLGFVGEVRSRSGHSWVYSGCCDFILVNCFRNKAGELSLDFDNAACLQLETLKSEGRLVDVSLFFRKIFDHCEKTKREDPAWGQGHDADPESPLIELCRNLLQNNTGQNRDFSQTAKGAPKSDQPDESKIVGKFRYDLGTNSLIIAASGQRHQVDTRYAEVLRSMFKKESGYYSIRTSHLTYPEVAVLFELGRWKENNPDLKDSELRRLKDKILNRIRDQEKSIAHEFRRQFSRWLRNLNIEPDSVLTADRKNSGYKLGNGWHSGRMVTGDSEVGLRPAARRVENHQESFADNVGRKTPPRLGMKGEYHDPQT